MSLNTRTMKFVSELCAEIGKACVKQTPQEIRAFLRDNSWLSPILREHVALHEADSTEIQTEAVVSPGNVAQLRWTIAIAARHGVPIVPRGGGSSNFGQTIPLQKGIILDTRQLDQILDVRKGAITAQAGTLIANAEHAARSHRQELTVLTTTATSATVAGWIAGGHVGIGSNTYGTLWDGNVHRASLLTVEDPPRELSLQGEDLYPILHTFGTTGVITEATLPLVPARAWCEAVATFEDFETAAHFTAEVAHESSISKRVVAAQEAPLAAGIHPLKSLLDEGQAVVLLIVDHGDVDHCDELSRKHKGDLHIWRESPNERKLPIAYMVYGHRMLWIKRQAPEASFLHTYCDPNVSLDQLNALKERFGWSIWLELKYIKSHWLQTLFGLPDEVVPAPVLTLVSDDQASVEEVMAFCDSIGVNYRNPHTYVLEESGIFPDIERINEFKRETDPHGLLNPGKLGSSFFAERGST